MNTKDLPALIDFLHGILMDGELHREHDLLKRTEGLAIFRLCAEDPNLGLFQKHFILMHALYVLRRDLFDAQMALLCIHSTRILLLPWSEQGTRGELSDYESSEKLEDYYLDFSNVIRETESSVASMLGQFWRRYAEYELVDDSEREVALRALGLSWPISEVDLKRSFREQAQALHPDRGGDKDAFINLRRNYETLKRALRQSH